MATEKLMAREVPEFKKVPTGDVSFDEENPRLGGKKGLSQPELQSLLMGEPHFAKELVDSFIENGFIEYEPLVVRQTGKKYTVIEGNRRLAAVKHILANEDDYPSTAVEVLKQVPVLVFHQKADASHLKEIKTYLGVRHLQGYREWPAESKAFFLDQNVNDETDLEKLTAEFGIEKNDIARFLIPYRIRKKAASAFKNIQLGDESSFWMLGEALSRAGIKQYIELDVDRKSFTIRSFNKVRLSRLAEFLYGSKTGKKGKEQFVDRVVTDTRQLGRLSKVLANKRASEALEKGKTLDEAELYLGSAQETINKLIASLKKILRQVKGLRPSQTQKDEIEKIFEAFLKTPTK